MIERADPFRSQPDPAHAIRKEGSEKTRDVGRQTLDDIPVSIRIAER